MPELLLSYFLKAFSQLYLVTASGPAEDKRERVTVRDNTLERMDHTGMIYAPGWYELVRILSFTWCPSYDVKIRPV